MEQRHKRIDRGSVLRMVEWTNNFDVAFLVLQFFDWKSLVHLAAVSRYWKTVSRDNACWSAQCKKMWLGKVHVLESAKQLLRNGKGFEAFRDAYLCGTSCEISYEDLTSFTWNFRFKKEAGDSFIAVDPWTNGKNPILNKFLPNSQHRYIVSLKHEDERINAVLYEIHRTWRFINARGEDMASIEGSRSAFIRGTVNGTDTPTYVVVRHSNWGYILQSCWVVFTSFAMPARADLDPELSDATMAVTIATQHGEAANYNFGALNVGVAQYAEMSDDDDDEFDDEEDDSDHDDDSDDDAVDQEENNPTNNDDDNNNDKNDNDNDNTTTTTTTTDNNDTSNSTNDNDADTNNGNSTGHGNGNDNYIVDEAEWAHDASTGDDDLGNGGDAMGE